MSVMSTMTAMATMTALSTLATFAFAFAFAVDSNAIAQGVDALDFRHEFTLRLPTDLSKKLAIVAVKRFALLRGA